MEYVEFCFKQVRKGGLSLQELVKVKMPETRRAFREKQVQVTILRLHCELGRTTWEIEAQILPKS